MARASDVLMVSSSIVLAILSGIAYIIRRKRTSRPPLGVSGLEELIGRPVKGFRSGYGCISSELYHVDAVDPVEYSGLWSCCRLGCGGWGCSYKCSMEDKVFVVKVPAMYRDYIESNKPGYIPTYPIREYKRVIEKAMVIKNLGHPHILRLLGYGVKTPVLIYEYADMGSIEWQLRNGWSPSVSDTVLIGIQVVDALRYIHGRGLVHGDVKPSNIFIVDNIVKLGDFSTLKILVSSSGEPVECTPGYCTPEHLDDRLWRLSRSRGFENRIDIYQFGNTLLYLLVGETIDAGEYSADRVYSVTERISDTRLRELVRETLCREPWSRPSSIEVEKRLYSIYKTLH